MYMCLFVSSTSRTFWASCSEAEQATDVRVLHHTIGIAKLLQEQTSCTMISSVVALSCDSCSTAATSSTIYASIYAQVLVEKVVG